MNPFVSPASVVAPPLLSTRSVFVTVLAWCTVVLSAAACLVSLAALLMLLAGSHGTGHATLLGGFVVIGVPPITLVAGVGLLRRWRWAYGYVLVLLASVAIWNLVQMLRGPTELSANTTYSAFGSDWRGSQLSVATFDSLSRIVKAPGASIVRIPVSAQSTSEFPIRAEGPWMASNI